VTEVLAGGGVVRLWRVTRTKHFCIYVKTTVGDEAKT